MQVIAFANDDGGVSIMTPITSNNAINDAGHWMPLRAGQEPPQGYRYPTVAEVAAKDAPEGYIIIDDSELPSREKREGWVIIGNAVGVDESKLPQPSPSDAAKALLATLPDAVKAKYYNTVIKVRSAIENNEWGVVPLLLAEVVPETPEETAALAQIKSALGV